ncbi:MAG: NAD(P)-binding domain-containing protein [Parvibaculaceae bacterium]
MTRPFPIAIIGAGPVGLAAAAHLVLRGEPVRIFETAPVIAANLRDWGHVRLFSVWVQCIDAAAATLLGRHGWMAPPANQLPLGRDLVADYLEPLAATPELAAVIETNTSVVRIARQGLDRMTTRGREARPFALTLRDAAGNMSEIFARAVIDTSGTWQCPNPLGADGWPIEGEDSFADRIAYGIPDISGSARENYASLRTLVMGSGHSAANALLDLATLARQEPATAVTWAVRGSSLQKIFGGGTADQLPARGALGERLRTLVDEKRLTIELSFAAQRLRKNGNGVLVDGLTPDGAHTLGPFDRIVAATGQRPDFSFAREIQLDLDPVVESSRTLGPLIDPNVHSCGTVPPHGWRELQHAEPDFFTAGIKSYGRAPTFLLLTGYEQVRSIAAHLAGDEAAANDVRLVLPETGVCNATLDEVAPGLCCEGAAPQAAEPCCARPEAKQATACCAGKPAASAAQPERRCC